MKDRILKFLKVENIPASKFAIEIGVQASSISHILAGRNNPSLELIQKILNRYDSVNPDWLILGKGEMYRTAKMPNLFSQIEPISVNEQHLNSPDSNINVNEVEKPINNQINQEPLPVNNEVVQVNKEKEVEKIIIIYNDGTFKAYNPSI